MNAFDWLLIAAFAGVAVYVGSVIYAKSQAPNTGVGGHGKGPGASANPAPAPAPVPVASAQVAVPAAAQAPVSDQPADASK